ncbi:CDP-diacylglycerol--glycerol-3-phosphate 3-phosphatidyltransferase [Roseicyclus sp. F158]|uniref:CDP-diacylglycerol--glycerol-3-phosphate 3-phosphatidyltransferase n=1 Tax=Tropicimonas omnivorans TaxID=3075590 RepID=A0ABU3DD02_9RHOB|nr:CDP-diacylglycerol--glycerol-3-phosphate 3-phosphatidyltransferase [Roseicyclus sp. F158]MDT0681595.1 CDP-diacylglycerol--glycerol-3-phosphate 3-phosphatidyltransferase [Roseicyclus sp. F158]
MKWTIPNILTTLRLLAAPGVPVMFLFFYRPWADWLALTLFIGASLTDWLDGYLARKWGQVSRYGAMLDPIADKAMVIIAIVVITGYSGMNPWLILPVTVILFREVFVSGLREFLGSKSGTLKVTGLAKWKTTAQMVAIGVIFLGTGLTYSEHGSPTVGLARVGDGAAGWATFVGIVLMWVAAVLTGITGWDYFNKARPYLRDE